MLVVSCGLKDGNRAGIRTRILREKVGDLGQLDDAVVEMVPMARVDYASLRLCNNAAQQRSRYRGRALHSQPSASRADASVSWATWEKSGAPGRSCTCNQRLGSALPCLLSYGSRGDLRIRNQDSGFMNTLAAPAGVAPARSESESDALLLSYRAVFCIKWSDTRVLPSVPPGPKPGGFADSLVSDGRWSWYRANLCGFSTRCSSV